MMPATLADLVTNLYVASAFTNEDRVKARDLMSDVIALAHDIVGHTVVSLGMPGTYHKDGDVLRAWLSVLYPLLEQAFVPPGIGKRILSVFDVMDALSALDAGEVQPIFVPNKGKNRRANRWSLAKAKLDALAWKKRLCALGYAEKAANHEITLAFGEQWDTIRKWKRQCENILGENSVYAALLMAGSRMDGYVDKSAGTFCSLRLDPKAGLKAAGEKYRAEVARSAELSKRKSGTLDRKAPFGSG
jgi:hypothetical protein